MKKLQFSIQINTPASKVWEIVTNESSYRAWTKAFNPTSHFFGSWAQGSKIVFKGSDDQGVQGGMVSKIEVSRPNEFISIAHLGFLKGELEDFTSEDVLAFAGAHENYTFTETNGVTTFSVELDAPEDFADYFNETWPKALEELKSLAETSKVQAITVSVTINAPVEKVWGLFTLPEHITKWCHASDDWHAPSATNDLRDGGKFSTTMAAKDGSTSFDFEGVYSQVVDKKQIDYTMSDGRKVSVYFSTLGGVTQVFETFDIELENSPEMQRDGWQAILENFKAYCER